MPAAKSGANIYITGLGNTLSSVVSDIADATFISDLGGGVYQVECSTTNRQLAVRAGGELTIGDPTDYSVSETLQFNPGANGRGSFAINHGSKFTMVGNTTINFSTTAYYTTNNVWQGNITISGDGTYNPLLYNNYRIYLQGWDNNLDNGTFGQDVIHLNNVTLGSVSVANNAFFMFDTASLSVMPHIFENILCDDTIGKNLASRFFQTSTHHNGMENITFSAITFDKCGYGWLNYGACIRLTDCIFNTTDTWKVYDYYSKQMFNVYRNFYDEAGDWESKPYGQSFSMYDRCIFAYSGSANGVVVGRGSTAVFRDCDWQYNTTAANWIQSNNLSRVLLWTGNTFYGSPSTFAFNASYGTIDWVHGLNVTVIDINGNPIENATVQIDQNNGFEKMTFKTNSSGKLIAMYDLEVALLTWKHQYLSSASALWSDSSNSTYHIVTVMKLGYNSTEATVVMDDEKEITMTLTPKQSHSLTF